MSTPKPATPHPAPRAGQENSGAALCFLKSAAPAASLPEQTLAAIRCVAMHADDAAAWRHIGGAARRRAQASFSDCGTPIAGLCGVLHMPLDALPALAAQPELMPTDPDALADCLRQAWALLHRVWPAAGRESMYFVRAIASGRLLSGRQSSGSSAECPFAIRIDFCSEDPIPLLADAIVHEASHVKLRLSGWLPALCPAEDTPRWRHPWRAELRPASAVIVACHAFVAVHGFHARRRAFASEGAAAVEAKLRGEVGQGLTTLQGIDGLTAVGRLFSDLLRSTFEAHCRLAESLRPHVDPQRQ